MKKNLRWSCIFRNVQIVSQQMLSQQVDIS